MRIFCTVFDKNYMFQGLALYNSLKRVAGTFKLYVLCMDEITYSTIAKLNQNNLIPVNLDSLLDREVNALRDRTTHGQFCWACQPLICQFILDEFNVDMVTYLEADSLFFSDPEVLFQELNDMSVTLSTHNYSPEFDKTSSSGRFCTQFNAFKNTSEGREVLDDWRTLCFKYDKSRLTFYPGQLLLNEWPEKFNCIKILDNQGAGVAPWNIQRYKFSTENGDPYVDNTPIVFYHFHSYGRYVNGDHVLGSYPIPKTVIDFIYHRYVNEIREAEAWVQSIDPEFSFRRVYENNITVKNIILSPSIENLKSYLRIIKRRLQGRYNVFSDSYFS
jgi:hypothetical protein